VVSVALVRALTFTALGLSLFLVAFLGYFTVPFVFLAAAVLILASSGTWRAFRRIRNALTR
jgi:hypothetical protein